MRKISKRGQLAPFSPIRKLTPFADKAKAEGVKVYHLNIGQPDLKMPKEICQELKKLVNTDYLPYANSQGLKENIEAWQKYYADSGISIETDEIVVTSGGSEGLIFVVATIADADEEIIVFEPFYANYNGYINLAWTKPVAVALDDQNGYHLPADSEIEKKIGPKTRAILFTNPNNPTGTVFSKEEIERLIKIAIKHDLFIISDEVYKGISFKGHDSLSVLDLIPKEEIDRVVIIDSLSKRLNVCGARVGAVISKNKELMSAMNRFAQERLSVATLDQQMVIPALRDCLPYIQEIATEYEKRRDAFIGTLEKELDIKIHYPEGAFYTMVKLPVKDSEDFAKWLLEEFRYDNSTVMVAPGPGFYATPGKGLNEVRVAYVLNVDELIKAAKVLAQGVKEYQKSQ